MHEWSVEDRRRRLVVRHHLAARSLPGEAATDGVPAAGPADVGKALLRVVRSLVGLHATDPVSVYLQARARLRRVTTDDVEHALYDGRTVARVLAMRRTMFVVDPADLAMLRAAVTDRLADRELRRTATWVEDADLADDGRAWVREAADHTLAALAEHGPMTALELRGVVPELAEQVVVNRGKAYEGKVGMSTRVLFWLATTGHIVRGRPGGSIASTNWQWARTEDWLDVDPDEHADPLESATALARRYLAAFGPATLEDLQWWTGWTKTLTRRALAETAPDEVVVDDGTGSGVVALVLPGDDRPPVGAAGDPVAGGDRAGSTVAFLPALDATPMGWKRRAWFLGRHTGFPGPLFDRNGNIGPTVWVDGQVVGAWGQRPDGRIAWRLLDDHLRIDEESVAAEAADLEAWLGDLRFGPRFPTPWQAELSS